MIDLEQSEKFLNSLTTFFNRRSLTQEQVAEYHKAIKRYPIEALREVYKILVRNQKPSAGSFPAIFEIIQLLEIWKHEHSEKFLSQREPCKDCGGNGFLVFWQSADDPDYPFRGYSYAINCASCKNKFFGTNFRPAATKEQIEQSGYEILKATDFFDKPKKTDEEQSVEDMAREIFNAD